MFPVFELLPASASSNRSKKFVFVFKDVSVAFVITDNKRAKRIACELTIKPPLSKIRFITTKSNKILFCFVFCF